MLEVRGVTAGYGGGPDVLRGLDLTVSAGEVVSLVGLNGAGKSTLVRTIAGLLPSRGGTVEFEGRELGSVSCDERCRRGLVLVPEGRELFAGMSVIDNIDLGTMSLPRGSRSRLAAEARQRVYDLFPILHERRRQLAGTLSGGQQQMVAVARALMSSPKLLILDEPSLGLAPQLVDEIMAVLRSLISSGLTILLVEQNLTAAMSISTRSYVLEHGVATESDMQAQSQRKLLATEVQAVRDAAGAAPARAPLPEYSLAGRRRSTTR